MKELYIGVMSGTSMDGIDLALCEIDSAKCVLSAYAEFSFPKALKEEILNLIGGRATLREIGELDAKLGVLVANAISDFMVQENVGAAEVKAIGLHGQTLWHQPEGEFPFSTQLGDANVVSARTGVKTVADFRRMDIANGGQGAPLVPAFHKFLFGSLEGKVAILNIGGMANITLLGSELKGWDTGCGNVLLDMWISQTRQKAYDENGEFAKSGEIDEELLSAMISDDYFKKLPPKSTGREYFNATWLANYLPIFNPIKDEDIQRTLLELTALSVANDIKTTNATKVVVCGGGAKNLFLTQRLEALCEREVVLSDSLGANGDALEAMAFAWLAYKRVKNEVVELSSVTGARKDSLLGGIYG
jgi:anhydro-N-acetylmuramic acid kinase